ncbi:hypothetical protein UFOVP30_18 [uncultured Caudovirales phage]|uniref:Tail tube protein n=1 Tax=uncultured Caudovirales phage TaxID=2100421 RepID=A0A6J5KQM5_9CAUD|nr:hypothetical protein UFOVP30_18 [uncultured Caudovirales phage]
MAVFLNNQVGFKLGTVDLSDHVKSITLNQKFDELEVTAMGDTGHKFVKGLESASITVSFLNDTATAQVLATLQAAYGASTAFKAVNTGGVTPTISATNPLYSGLVLVNNLTPINGAVGDISTQDITFTVNGSISYAITGTW